MRILFLPFSITAGLIAGALSKRVFNNVWALFDEEQAPGAHHRDVSVVKLVLALAIEGAVARTVGGLLEHGARRGFRSLTGTWPGEEAPEPS